MSLFVQHGTCMNDAQVLKKVLGTRFKEVELHATPQNLFDYTGKQTHYLSGDPSVKDAAEIIVRRKFVGGAANDIGFKRNTRSGGNFDAIISQYDSGKQDIKWLENLSRDYLIEKAKALMTEQESELVGDPETLGDGSVRMKFRVNAMA